MMVRLFSLAALAALFFMVAGSHDFLLAKPGNGNGTQCAKPTEDCEAGERWSRRDCACVPKGANKQLVCHLSTDDETEEVTGEVISVSEESAHLRKDKHGDCPAGEEAEVGSECECIRADPVPAP